MQVSHYLRNFSKTTKLTNRNMNIKDKLTPYIKTQMEEELQTTVDPIFVFLGIEQYVNLDEFSRYIIDNESFLNNGNQELFNQVWFSRIFTKLTLATTNTDLPYTVLSFPQFSYLINYIQPDYFKNRIIIVKDGFRSLLPISERDYIEKTSSENIEERAESMPIYMAEQLQILGNYYYTIKTPIEDYMTLNVFTQEKSLSSFSDEKELEVIDTVSDPYGIDIFINRCILECDFSKKALVKVFNKQPMKRQEMALLQKLNGLLSLFSGQLYELDEKAIQEEYQPTKETIGLLNTYWGEKASFRQIRVYKNPDYGKEVVNISQGVIVDTIIGEYKKSKNHDEVRDLFLTAPTGAGKSLLFQLPAFYVSSQKDVTIVISPLIALMKDQVEQIRQERGFTKVYYLNSELSLIDREKVIEDCQHGDIDILYMSPELLLSYDVTYFIGSRQLGLLVIDEAHLITTWGRDFRVDYWFLGQHINKLRKNANCKFPIVAVTATAIYGGDNDMVFDSINSLYMHNPHLFIGEVKRKNITFIIDNHEKYKSNYDIEKEKETVRFIEDVANEGIKTIVYAPYRRHIDNIMTQLSADRKEHIAVAFHSGLNSDMKNAAYDNFRNNNVKIMVSTKAFGMGVDIPDIQLVYHHAPSGLLPDYIQEVGRAARKSDINGFASLSYAIEDQRYSKMLHGMSALRHYQIREVINKINRLFIANGKKRNLLVSTDDFSYIFGNTLEYDQKVMTALMMIEKDYLAKNRFNVLIARPKKLFVKVYARVNNYGMKILEQKHAGCYSLLCSISDELKVVELDLDKIWKQHFSDRSFPMLKHDFYEGKLLDNEKAECKPQVNIFITLNKDEKEAIESLSRILDSLQNALSSLLNRFFTKTELDESLCQGITNRNDREKVINFLLATYSSRSSFGGDIDNDAFLQKRRSQRQEEQYRVFNNKYANNFAKLKRRLQKVYENKKGDTYSSFVSNGSDNLSTYIRLGSLMEILGIGSYECRGGDNPMIFIRINDPRRIAYDASDKGYKNSLLTSVEKRYKISFDIFDHFFLHSFSNEERWNFIEECFLGESCDDLLRKFPGGEQNHVDIISYLRNHKGNSQSSALNDNEDLKKSIHFPPREKGYYAGNNLLTIDGVTKTIEKWILEAPVEIDKIRRRYNLHIEKRYYDSLISKIKVHHFPYYRDIMGLSLKIEFPGYDKPVLARIPYVDYPVKFYKWWKNNENKVSMSRKEMIDLFLKVNEVNDKTLLKKHREVIMKK